MIDLDLILKHFRGEASPEDSLQIEEWAASSPAKRNYLESLRQTWLATGAESIPTHDLVLEWEALNKKKKTNIFNPK